MTRCRSLRHTAATIATALATIAGASEATAQHLELPDAPEAHAFVSQGFIVTSANDYLADSSRGSFEFAEAGITVSSALSDRLRVGAQRSLQGTAEQPAEMSMLAKAWRRSW